MRKREEEERKEGEKERKKEGRKEEREVIVTWKKFCLCVKNNGLLLSSNRDGKKKFL